MLEKFKVQPDSLTNRSIQRFVGVLDMLGSAGLVISQAGVMVNHPLTKSIHSFLHIAGFGSGILLLAGLAGYTLVYFARLRPLGLIGVGLSAVGLILYICGNFNYAVFHGLLNWVTINDPIHQVPLDWAPLALTTGTFLIGLAATRNKTLSLPLAFLMMISSVIYGLGWLQVGYSMQRQRNLSRYLKALLIVLPFGLAWFWSGVEQFKKRLS